MTKKTPYEELRDQARAAIERETAGMSEPERRRYVQRLVEEIFDKDMLAGKIRIEGHNDQGEAIYHGCGDRRTFP